MNRFKQQEHLSLKRMKTWINNRRFGRALSRLFMLLLYTLCCDRIRAGQIAQHISTNQAELIIVDGQLQYRKNGNEASFFGVNYCTPFAHSYRALQKLGKNHKEEIDKDIYHFARLGFDGFRIHIWDTEISDSLGNLINNEHLDLLDYMLWKLQQRGIRIILTPLTFYNNGYPDDATQTGGFANTISKGQATRKEFRPVIKRYLSQFIAHVNPYNSQSYTQNPDIIAVEIINEPAHGGKLSEITEFVDDLADHLRSCGWEKPVFYNISQNPDAVEAVMNARIDGAGFQWYPAGLVGGAEIKNNYLPYIDTYAIPFADEPAFKSKVQFVYEFDSADVLHSCVYPAMARSFRQAGFQWATQFAYDPMAIAYVNSDYQTHYLNLACTPSKAISMLIASMVFHHTPLHKDCGQFPADTLFADFRLSHSLDLSEMNADTAFYYSNDTQAAPRNSGHLKHIAGVGSSRVIAYEGSGAYFLDKLEKGIWRLEVMPDAAIIRDPFERPSFAKHVVHIDWRDHQMKINLPDLGGSFRIQGLNAGNEKALQADAGSFTISPGSYLLLKKGKNNSRWTAKSRIGPLELGEFVAPTPSPDIPAVKHTPYQSVEEDKPVPISAIVSGIEATDTVWLIAGNGRRPRQIVMHENRPCVFFAEIPADLVKSGFLHYWIMIEQKDKKISFPGNHAGTPFDWDYFYDELWEVPVVRSISPIELFNTRKDHQRIDYAFSWWNRNAQHQIVAADAPGQMAIRSTLINPSDNRSFILGWQIDIRDQVAGRKNALRSFENLGIQAKGINGNTSLRIILIDRHGGAYVTSVSVTNKYANYSISMDRFKSGSMMLLPRPFPLFQPVWYKSAEAVPLRLPDIETVQVLAEPNAEETADITGFEVVSIWLEP
jgi:hypothetical protein